MTDRKVNDTAAAKTIVTHNDIPEDIKKFLTANRIKVMKFYNGMMSPEQNAVWEDKQLLGAFDLSDEFKARASAAFDEAVDAKVDQFLEQIEEQVAELIHERNALVDYIERECQLDGSQLDELSKGLLGRYIAKASADAQEKSAEGRSQTLSATQSDQLERKVGNRNKGISRAVTRLTTESSEALNEAHMARYVNAIRRTFGLY